MATSTKGASSDGAATKKPAHGDIGRQTYEDVRKLVEQGMKKTEAFAKVAKQSGRSANTVMTQYYRTAREQVDGGGVRRTARTARTGARTAAKSANQQTERLISEAKTAIDALQAHIAELERDLERAAQESKEFEKIRKMLHKR
jgi:phosphohistidine phosphatase SixA